MGHVLSDLFTMTSPSWVALLGMVHSFIKLYKALSHNKAVILEGDFVLSAGTILRPEKAMAYHSSTLAWKIPWMEEPGGLQTMGSLRVRHD